MLGRLLSLRPDLAQDQQANEQVAQGQAAQAPGQQPQHISTASPIASAIGGALDDFYQLTILKGARDLASGAHHAIDDPADFLHSIGPTFGGFAPIANELPLAARGAAGAIRTFGQLIRPNDSTAGRPPDAQDLPAAGGAATPAPAVGNAGIGRTGYSASSGFRSVQLAPASSIGGTSPSSGSSLAGGVLLPGLGLAAVLANQGGKGLPGGLPQPIAPVWPQPTPTVQPVAPQGVSIPPEPAPTPQPFPLPPQVNHTSPQAAPAPPSDPRQDALRPAWQRLQSYFRSNIGEGSPSGDRDDAEECRKEWEEAFKECSKHYRNDRRNITGPFRTKTGAPWTPEDCARGLVSERCGGNPVDYGVGRGPKR